MGGSNAGEVNYPAHMLSIHKEWLYGNQATTIPAGVDAYDLFVAERMYAASTKGAGGAAASPYYQVSSYTGIDADLDTIQDQFEMFEQAVRSMTPEATLEYLMNRAVDIVTSEEVFSQDDIDIDATVDAAEQRSKAAFQRGAAEITAGLFDIRAVMSSQFGVALALHDAERQQQLTDYDKQLRIDIAKLKVERGAMTIQLTQAMMDNMIKAQTLYLGMLHGAASLQADISRHKIVTKNDELQFDLQLEVADALWDLELFQYANQTLSSIADAATFPQKTKFDRIMEAAQFGTSLLTGVGGLALGALSLMSDKRCKQHIEPIKDATDLLLRLKGVTYEYRGTNDPRLGFVAQDVEQVFPHWVKHTFSGYKYLEIVGFEGLVTEAVRELDARIKRLEDQSCE